MRDSVPEDGSFASSIPGGRIVKRHIFDALGVDMDFASIFLGQTVYQFGDGALRAVAAIDERRNNGDAQVSVSSVARSEPQAR